MLADLLKVFPISTESFLCRKYGKAYPAIQDAYEFAVKQKKMMISRRVRKNVTITVYAAAYADGIDGGHGLWSNL